MPWLLLLLWSVLCAALVLWGRRLPPPDEVHTTPTDDGWILTLYRFVPPPGVPRRPVPVVLAHGILMNRRCWELSPATSVPRWLAARGHDTWVAEYRGTPSSQPPPAGGRWRYDPRDHARSDLPAILRCVRRESGAADVSWVGHSMGGMVAYLNGAAPGAERLHRLVTLGSPARFGPGGLRPLLQPLRRLLDRPRRVPLQALLVLVLPFAVFAPWTGSRLAFHPPNLGWRERAGLFGGAFVDVSALVHRWFVDLKLRRQRIGDGEGPDRLAPGDLGRLQAPLLIVAAQGDRIAPPRSVLAAAQHAGSPKRQTVLFGGGRNDRGPSGVFGHNDLMCSGEALLRVWPRVARWLEADDAALDEIVGTAMTNAGAECSDPSSSP